MEWRELRAAGGRGVFSPEEGCFRLKMGSIRATLFSRMNLP